MIHVHWVFSVETKIWLWTPRSTKNRDSSHKERIVWLKKNARRWQMCPINQKSLNPESTYLLQCQVFFRVSRIKNVKEWIPRYWVLTQKPIIRESSVTPSFILPSLLLASSLQSMETWLRPLHCHLVSYTLPTHPPYMRLPPRST